MAWISPFGRKHPQVKTEENILSKRLCYVLRYGARKEGLTLHSGGFVDINDILTMKMMSKYNLKTILVLARRSRSSRGTLRFETRMVRDRYQMRAVYGQSMEASIYHENTRVPTLQETCITTITTHINMYNLDDFPDQYLHGRIFRRLKRDKRLNNAALRVMITPVMERLNLSGVYLTERTFDIICEQGRHIKVLNLCNSGYVVNDHIIEKLLMKLVSLESLNMSGCVHITDRSLRAIMRYRPSLLHLSASTVWQLTGPAIIDLIMHCNQLQLLDIYDNKLIDQDVRDALVEVAKHRKITIILKHLTDPCIEGDEPAKVLDMWLDKPC